MEYILEIARTKDGDYYFKITGEDKQVIAQSEEYETLATCKRAMHALSHCIKAPVFEAAPGAFWTGRAVYEIYEVENGFTFLLKGDYGEVLAYGNIFENMRACRSAIASMIHMDMDHETEFEVF